MEVVLDMAALTPHHQRDLGMRLQAEQPVHHVNVGLFQGAGPTDVCLLVAAGLDLDQRDNLLAALRGANERSDDGARVP